MNRRRQRQQRVKILDATTGRMMISGIGARGGTVEEEEAAAGTEGAPAVVTGLAVKKAWNASTVRSTRSGPIITASVRTSVSSTRSVRDGAPNSIAGSWGSSMSRRRSLMIRKNDGAGQRLRSRCGSKSRTRQDLLMLLKSKISPSIVTLVTYTLHYPNTPPTHPKLQLPGMPSTFHARALLFPVPTSTRHTVSIWPANRSGSSWQKKKTASTDTYSGPRMSSRQLLRQAHPRDD
jgi:hypothetical protein